ncbi:hypothetical protein EsH8_V_000003 [Colletotrichum jinshuiense]
MTRTSTVTEAKPVSGEEVPDNATNMIGSTNMHMRNFQDTSPISQAEEAIEEWVEQGGEQPRQLGVTWHNLTITGVHTDATFNENVASQLYPLHKRNKSRPTRKIIDNLSGCVKPGEMLLVLGRPGAGCTSLLNVLSNNRNGYEEIKGDVFFGNMTAEEAEQFRGQIVMNTEEEIFYPALSVEATISFAARMKAPHHLPPGIRTPEEYVQRRKDFLLRLVGISHTASTKVGDAYTRGVSGGERKRVSIIECLTTRASVFCWDNSTRGLDASTALEWIKAMRVMTDLLGLTTIITLYQAGNGIYEQFDKVLVLDEGKQMFYGPQKEAVPFMESQGFLRDSGSNRSDFLTGVTVPTERVIAPGFEKTFPRTADEIRAAYDRSAIKTKMMDETQIYPQSNETAENTALFKEMVAREKHKGVSKRSPVTSGFLTQVKAAITRQYQILWGDKSTLIMKQGATVIQSLVGGSLFYAAPDNSLGLFLKGGALFFSILYNALIALSEVTDSFTGRPILAKHRSFALYRPAAICLAQIAADAPILLFQVTHFGLVLYFMVGLKLSAGAFFTYLVTNFVTAMSMTAVFRLIGAAFPTFDAATKVSGLTIVAFFVYMGYMIFKSEMHPWLGWIFWINPMAYGFEALLGNEFHGQDLACVGPNLVPNGPGYTAGEGGQACVGVAGARVGATSVTGDEYLAAMSFSHSHVWRNVGIICAWWVVYVALTIYFTSKWKLLGDGGRSLLIPRENQKKSRPILGDLDEEFREVEKSPGRSIPTTSDDESNLDLIRNESIFTWRDLTYTVKTSDGTRVLLDNVNGYVKPGMLGALMGSSGAGKTTLLDVLAQRKTEGTIHGSILVDGHPLPISFQRSAGYVEQLDVHEPLATVREALEFSALLRQSRNTPVTEKLQYVDKIIDLLELHDLEHTLVGQPGAGLSVEQRKRLTIGVELVAKPSILIFLDEPTSGLDGQAAYNTIRFLRKLASVGQAILVTIHQPSAQLFSQFDTLLLLAKGGKTTYFGEIGEKATTVIEYFGRHGEPCPPEANPAEHIIEVVSGAGRQSQQDWNKIWLESPEHTQLMQDLSEIIEQSSMQEPKVVDDGQEFAASMWTQIRLVTHRMNVSLFRNTEYLNNKFALHITLALLNGFSFWMIGDRLTDMQSNLFSVFNLIFVAPGVISQLQPLFIDRRDIYEAREKKSKMYHWAPFVTGLIVSEFPYLIICAVLYYVCWYFTCGFSSSAEHAGSVFFVVLMYECLYTGIGQMIAAYTPNAVFASLVNPLVITTLVSFCGVMVPYSQIQDFWKYWIYYIDPFNYLMSSLLIFTTWDKSVDCSDGELAVVNPAPNQTCGAYLSDYQLGMGRGTNLLNPDAMADCRVIRPRTMSHNASATPRAAVWSLMSSNPDLPVESAILPDDGSNGTDSIFDVDERTPVHPQDFANGGKFRSVVKIQACFNKINGERVWMMGSGWLVREDIIVTAGHVVYDWGHRLQSAIEVKCYIGYCGRASVGTPDVQGRFGQQIITTAEWIEAAGNRTHDVAFIKVNRPFTGHLKLFRFRDTPLIAQVRLGVVGYPGDKCLEDQNGKGVEKGARMYEEFAYVDYDVGKNKRHMIEYQISTFAGQCGAPIFISNSHLECIGTHCYGGGGDKNSGNSIGGPYGVNYIEFIPLFDSSQFPQIQHSGIKILNVERNYASSSDRGDTSIINFNFQSSFMSFTERLGDKAGNSRIGYQGNQNFRTENVARPLRHITHENVVRPLQQTISNPGTILKDSSDENGFFDIIRSMAKVAGPAVSTVTPFLGPIGGPISAVAGSMLSTIGAAENVICDRNASSVVETVIESGVTERAVLAEASLQALLKLDTSPETQELLRNVSSKYSTFKPKLDAIATVARPQLTEAGLHLAHRQMAKLYEQGLTGIQESENELPREMLQGVNRSALYCQQGQQQGAFIQGLLAPTRPILSEDGSLDFLGPMISKGITFNQPFTTSVAQGAIQGVINRLGGGVNFLSDAPPGTHEHATILVFKRAAAAEAALQILMTLSEDKLDCLRINNPGAREESFIDEVKTAIQKMAPGNIDITKTAIRRVVPVIVEAASQRIKNGLKLEGTSALQKIASGYNQGVVTRLVERV